MTVPRVLGLDLSMTATGMAHPDGDLDTVRTVARDGDQRLARIDQALLDVIEHTGPSLAAIEDLPMGLRNVAAGALGMVHGVARLRCIREHVAYVLVPPATLKTYATGRGNCTKPDMRVSLLQRTGLDVPDDNQCDAAWLRLLALDLLGWAVISLPGAHRRALKKLALPEGVTT